MKETFQKLDLNNSFLFAAALEDPDTCQLVLEIIFGCKMPKVKAHAEHSILVSSDFRSVRLDIYANDEMQVNYNVEAQNENEGNLAKRSRYHQAEMDVASLKPWDETRKIFLSTKGRNDKDVPQELVHFLKYMEQSTDEYVSGVTDDSIIRLHEKVTKLKQWRELEARYMTVEELLQSRERKGRAEGKQEDILELLETLGTVSAEVRDKISAERNPEVLRKWLKLAAGASSLEAFLVEM